MFARWGVVEEGGCVLMIDAARPQFVSR